MNELKQELLPCPFKRGQVWKNPEDKLMMVADVGSFVCEPEHYTVAYVDENGGRGHFTNKDSDIINNCELFSPTLDSLSAPVQDEHGWLIEHFPSDPSRPLYWNGGISGISHRSWTDNHLRAVRFARKEDAEIVTNTMFSGACHRVCEHIWSSENPRIKKEVSQPKQSAAPTPAPQGQDVEQLKAGHAIFCENLADSTKKSEILNEWQEHKRIREARLDFDPIKQHRMKERDERALKTILETAQKQLSAAPTPEQTNNKPYTPCGKFWGLGHDIECKHGILIDVDEYHEGFDPNVIRQPCSCNPKFCKSCNGTGEQNGGDCPDCKCGWVGGIDMLADELEPAPTNKVAGMIKYSVWFVALMFGMVFGAFLVSFEPMYLLISVLNFWSLTSLIKEQK